MASRSVCVSFITSYCSDSQMHDDLLAKVTNLDNGCKEIESYFSEYDYDVHTPANGFRSYVRIVNTFMSRIAFLLQQEPDDENTGLLQEYETVASTLIKVLDMMKIVREKGLSPDHTHIMDQDIRLFTHAFNITEQDIEPFFSEAGPFWIRTSFIPQFQKVKMFIAMLSLPSLRQKLKFMYDKEFAHRIMIRNAITSTPESLKRTANMHQFPINMIMMRVKKPDGLRKVSVENTCDWVIEVTDADSIAVVKHVPKAKKKRKKIPMLIVEPPGRKDSCANSVVFHSHGGWGICCTSENYQFLLSYCAIVLGVTIICPDYRKAPLDPYPAGVQDLLHAYMFITSGTDQVKQVLGFLPDNVVLTGDSCGAHFSLSITIALNMIRKTGYHVLMPSGISVMYPIINPGPIAYPSTALMPFDSPSHYALPLAFYTRLQPAPACYWHQKEDSADVMRKLANRCKDPLYNAEAYDGFEDLDDISLRVLVCEMDAALDQGISLARKWKGGVKVQVARELPHAFILSASPRPIFDDVRKLLTMITELLRIRAGGQ